MVASVSTGADSPWFSGHFPGDPILPGIAQLRMVAELIAGSGAGNLRMAGLSRVKFRKIVRADEVLDISHFAHLVVGVRGGTAFRIGL